MTTGASQLTRVPSFEMSQQATHLYIAFRRRQAGKKFSLNSLETAFLMVNEPYNPFVRAVPRDYQVIDISVPSDPLVLATVKQVKHKVVNSTTGTTFLLGSEGLTVIRRTSVENDYKVHLMQQSSN